MLEGDIKKIAAAAGGVEHTHGAEPVVEGAGFLDGGLEIAAPGERDRGGAHVRPLLA